MRGLEEGMRAENQTSAQIDQGLRMWIGSTGHRHGQICGGVDQHSGYADEMARRHTIGGEQHGC
jgi:hypothetical protein